MASTTTLADPLTGALTLDPTVSFVITDLIALHLQNKITVFVLTRTNTPVCSQIEYLMSCLTNKLLQGFSNTILKLGAGACCFWERAFEPSKLGRIGTGP